MKQPEKTDVPDVGPSRAERDTSLASTFADFSKARDGERPGGPEPKAIPTPGLSARVTLDRSASGLYQPVAGSLILGNEMATSVDVAQIAYRIEPRTGSVPAGMIWTGAQGAPKPPTVPACGELSLPFNVGAFTHPQVRPAIRYWIEATVLFADGTQIDSAPASIVVSPPV